MKRILTTMMVMIVIGGLLVIAASPLNAADEKKAEQTGECCAVCKTPVDKSTAKFKTEYNGKTVYFASEKCMEEFKKNPEKYQAPAVAYVCPMKQCNVKSDKPGKCPKCGMDLKKVEAKAGCGAGCCAEKKEEKKETEK